MKEKILPSDLSIIVPEGTGIYGYQSNDMDPFKHGPVHNASGGIIFFGNSIKKEFLSGFLNLVDIEADDKDYQTFLAEAENPGKDGYIKQMRIVSKFGLRFMFNSIDDKEYDSFPDQELSLAGKMMEFMKSEEDRWGTYFGASPKLAGVFGGDGDYAREELSFGFMIENAYHRIYRIWSRAWLVTK